MGCEHLLGQTAAGMGTAVIHDREVPCDIGPVTQEAVELLELDAYEVLSVLVFGPREDAVVLAADREHHGQAERCGQIRDDPAGAREPRRETGLDRPVDVRHGSGLLLASAAGA